MKRTIINIDKGPRHIYESMHQNQIEGEQTEPTGPIEDSDLFNSPYTSWASLCLDSDDP